MSDYDELISYHKKMIEYLEMLKSNELSNDFEELKKLLYSDNWPQAVDPSNICNDNEEEKIDRAESIIEFLDYDFANMNFLDFGCGEGHLVKKLAKNNILSIGYDILAAGNFAWEIEQNGMLTSNWNNVLKKAPFDFILLFDVLDHCQDPLETLEKLKSISKKETIISIRCHPYTSPHGGHLYQQLNKSYVHLIFTDEEIKKLGLKQIFTQKILRPQFQYKKWFEQSNMQILKFEEIKIDIDDFFRTTNVVLKRIPQIDENIRFPEHQMSQAFNDYKLQFSSHIFQ